MKRGKSPRGLIAKSSCTILKLFINLTAMQIQNENEREYDDDDDNDGNYFMSTVRERRTGMTMM